MSYLNKLWLILVIIINIFISINEKKVLSKVVLERGHIHEFTEKTSSCGKSICVGKLLSFMRKRGGKEKNMSKGIEPEY